MTGTPFVIKLVVRRCLSIDVRSRRSPSSGHLLTLQSLQQAATTTSAGAIAGGSITLAQPLRKIAPLDQESLGRGAYRFLV